MRSEDGATYLVAGGNRAAAEAEVTRLRASGEPNAALLVIRACDWVAGSRSLPPGGDVSVVRRDAGAAEAGHEHIFELGRLKCVLCDYERTGVGEA